VAFALERDDHCEVIVDSLRRSKAKTHRCEGLVAIASRVHAVSRLDDRRPQPIRLRLPLAWGIFSRSGWSLLRYIWQ
jgi:hypothetical protein